MFVYKHKSNKLYVFIMFIFVILLGCLYKIKATSLPLMNYTFYIDPGHQSKIKPGINRTSCSKL